jgi:uncharacterized membrane protein
METHSSSFPRIFPLVSLSNTRKTPKWFRSEVSRRKSKEQRNRNGVYIVAQTSSVLRLLGRQQPWAAFFSGSAAGLGAACANTNRRMVVLLGVALVVAGFALRFNPLLVVTAAGIVSALLGGISPLHILDAFGNGFADSRSVTIAFLVLPVIGLLERYGLRQRAKQLISQAAALTAGRLLLLYLAIRQLTVAFGLNIGGAAQMVRPVIYPMAEGAVIRALGDVPERVTELVKAHSAAADTVGAFFGEDCFIAVGSILLITSYVNASYHVKLDPLQLAVWAIPTAIAAFVIHGFRLLRFDGTLARLTKEPGA